MTPSYHPVTQRFEVTFADGSTREACCGPKVLTMLEGTGVAYRAIGEPVSAECCHYSEPSQNLQVISKVERAILDEHLAEMATRPTLSVGLSFRS